MSEPTIERYHRRTLANRVGMLVAATRPAFLTASVLPVLAGSALAALTSTDAVPPPLIALAAVDIALVHAGANVLNDYFDSASGNDRANTAFVHPFSGGSRFIQNAVLSEGETLRFGVMLMAAGAALGTLVVGIGGPLLLALGLVGTLLAVVYSSPPCLACRGLGDVVIGICFGLLPVAGMSLLLTGSIPIEAWWVGGVIACFVAAILWVNSIPDIESDRAAGKMTLPARLGHAAASRALVLWFAAGFLILLVSPLPRETWIALAAALPAALASRAAVAGRLVPAMPLTIITHAAVCTLLIGGLLAAIWRGA